MKASLTKLYTVSITSAHSLSAFCRFAGPLEVKSVLRQLHCDKHKADNPFSLDTLHRHHFSVMLSSFSAREHWWRQMPVQKSGLITQRSCGCLHHIRVPTSEVQQIRHSNTTR